MTNFLKLELRVPPDKLFPMSYIDLTLLNYLTRTGYWYAYHSLRNTVLVYKRKYIRSDLVDGNEDDSNPGL
jgi:hypothetical protein